MTRLPPPLSGEVPAEVHLPRAPLVLVVAQVRFPMILAIRNPDRVAVFQEAIRGTYPDLHQDQVAHLVLSSPDRLPTAPGVSTGLIWRFLDNRVSWQWRVSLAIDYIALETKAFTSIPDFSNRLRVIVSEFERAFSPQEAQRIGVRYVDRLVEPAYGRIADFFRREVLGLAATELGLAAQQIGAQAIFDAEEGQILARWGQVPAQATVDPEIAPIDGPSWVIDLDMFTPSTQSFETEDLIAKVTRYSKRIYGVFRWMVNDEFLRFYGGEPRP
jgi:uncharacterized protein (TIGR04255 family)